MRRLPPTTIRKPIAIGTLLLSLVILVLLIPRPAWADVDNFSFDSFSAEYTLSRAADGTSGLKTVETLVPAFPNFDQNRGIVRRIPAEYKGVDTHLRVISVTTEHGERVPYTVDRSAGDVAISIGDDSYLRGRHTFVITYTQRNVISTDPKTGNQEFYWDVNGDQWAQWFSSVSATVRMAPELAAQRASQTLCVVGDSGSTTPCTRGPGRPSTSFTAAASGVSAGQTMTIGVSFRAGTFVIPVAPAHQPWAIGMGVAGILLAVAGFVTALIARLRHWRDAPGRGIVVAQYEPPAQISVFEAADLVGGMATAHALPAFVLDLAVRGNAKLIEGKQRLIHTDYELQFLNRDGLNDLEISVVSDIFTQMPEPGTTTSLTNGPTHRGDEISETLAGLPTLMRDRKLRAHPAHPLPSWVRAVAFGAPALAIVFAAVLWLTGAAGLLSWSALGLAVVSLIGNAIVLYARPSKLTQTGTETKEYLQGLRLFIEVAEERRLQVLQSAAGAERRATPSGDELVHLYERLLPYAVLFGQEKSWARALDTLYKQTELQPGWISGPSPFTTGMLIGTINGLSSSMTSGSGAVASSSSSSSGFSGGGGFAGGGGGGGGGGGR